MTVTVITAENTSWTYPLTESAYVSYSGTFILKDHSSGQESIIVDPINHVIKGLSLYYSNYESNNGIRQGGDLSLDFYSISYKDSSGILTARGRYGGTYSLTEVYEESGDIAQNGSCSTSGTVTDSVSIEIRPANSSVAQAQNVAVVNPLIVETSPDGGLIITSQALPSTNNRLEVMDVLGRMVMLQTATPDQREFNLSNLPPGCYFARLGDQVAKFVVPPR